MDNTPRPAAFTSKDIAKWEDAFLKHAPKPPNVMGFQRGISIASFIPNPSPTGMMLMVGTVSGTEHFIELNPVVAKRLVQAICELGQRAGWLDAEMNVTAGPHHEPPTAPHPKTTSRKPGSR